MAGRGQLTNKIKTVALKELGIIDLSVTALRLMPYIQYTMMNGQKIDPTHINPEERKILKEWKEQGWMEGGMTGLSISKKFWDAMNEILWLGYVAYGEED
jgi:hypothetical protein